MYNFCTYFDSHYIHKGLALYESLHKVENNFTLYIMALDNDCYIFLSKLSLSNVVIENFNNIETNELRSKKNIRTRAEYCWTCGPFIIEHFITSRNLPDITYIDSDMMFFASPKIIFDEIGNYSIAITEHNAERKIPQGKYCVQYMYFKNNDIGISCLRWWKDRCIEWCYARFEGKEKYGDQKYLEQFSKRFKDVLVIQNKSVCVAGWNAHTYKLDNFATIYKGKYNPLIIFHYHGTKFNIENNVLVLTDPGNYLSKNLKPYFEEYCKLLIEIYNKYLNKNIKYYKIKNWTIPRRVFKRVKHHLYSSRIIRYIYYNIFKTTFNGSEEKQI